MADSELLKVLKDFSGRLQSASLKERSEVIENVIAVLDDPGITGPIVKGICKQLQQTLFRYRDRKSRLLVEKLLGRLLDQHGDVAVKSLTQVLQDVGTLFQNLIATRSLNNVALNALSWSVLLKEPSKEVVEVQSVLYTAIMSGDNRKQKFKADSLIGKVISRENYLEFYVESLLALEESKFVAVFGSGIIQSLPEKKVDLLPKLMDVFIKNFVSCKTRPLPNLVLACYPLLVQLDEEQFKKTLLPALQKTMLRNPEIILESVGLILSGLSLDLSPFALDLGNNFIGNLHSKDEQARSEAAEACRRLALKINNSKSLEELIKKTFQVFDGSNGKLTVVEHKLSVLQGIGNFSQNQVLELDSLISVVMELFYKVIQIEVNEKVLCQAIEQMTFWSQKHKEKLPQKTLDCFVNALKLKSSTGIVRIAQLQSILTTCNAQNCDQFKILTPILLKSLEKMQGQNTQSVSLHEGLNSCLILLKLPQENEKDSFQSVFNVIFEGVFFADKFLDEVQDDALLNILNLSELLLNKFQSKLKDLQGVYQAIISCIVKVSKENQRKALEILKRIVENDQTCTISIGLLKELKNCDFNEILLQKIVANVCCVQQPSLEGLEKMILEAILPSYTSDSFWTKLVRSHNLKPKDFIARHFDEIKKRFITNYEVKVNYEKALEVLSKLNAEIVVSCVVNKVIEDLKKDDTTKITKDDYFVFLTPEGELYDKSVVPGEESSEEMNLKRESKAYSYKDQLEELQLRRELQEKKRKEGKLKQPQFTPKQIEAIKNQKLKEQLIREDISKINERLCKTVSMLKAVSEGNPLVLSLNFKILIPIILEQLQSFVAAPLFVPLYLQLRRVVFSKDFDVLAQLIAFVTLRLSKPKCDLDSSWEEENLNKAMPRTVKLLHDLTVTKEQLLNVPAFTYIFSLIKLSITSNYAKNHEELKHDCLQIISKHTKMRGSTGETHHPKYLPTKQMFALLVDVISNSSGRVQSQAEACLLEVAQSVNGDPGSAQASKDEIEVLLTALQSPTIVVRDAALRGLTIIKASLLVDEDEVFKLNLNKRLYIATFDTNSDNRILAEQLWSLGSFEYPSYRAEELLFDIEHPVECVQSAASQALATLLKSDLEQVKDLLEKLISLYKNRLKMTPAKLDEFGRVVEPAIDTWFPRRGVGLALAQLAPLITPDLIGQLVEFFVSNSLSDRNELVRQEMLNAALKIVDLHGKETVGTLWLVFDTFMAKSSKSAHFDAVKEAVVVLMGSLARHLDKDDPRIKPIVMRLIQALSTPSQTVQEAVVLCLPPLISSVKDEAPGLINKLLHQLLKGDKYGERKGAAYGLAALVKGLGILALKQHDIMTKLTDAIQDKKNYKHREGALFAFEMLFNVLGKLFEPYIVHALPHLLQCFGDTSQYVRTAADDTAKIVMSKLSGHGVKLVLPSLLDALEEDSWRTKTGSVELLGAMAYCAPKQLSSCLPSIVPKLIEVLSDSHMKVQEAGAAALKVIGSVIRNPEIQAIVPVLLRALQDPSNKTSVCLQTLLDTQFVHFIDAPSLALIMPVVQRAFMDRSTETRKMAAQIIGNMYSLTDQKDLMPYLPTIIPGLKTSLLDPVPEVRSVSARALGAMVRGMGESSFEDLLPWLMQTLTSESSSVDRSGAAQGLSEVVGGLGVEKLHKLMPEIISTAKRTDILPHVKDGYIMMFIYMPVVFTSDFTPYIGDIINPILKALADENEYVRDTALKAGQRIVTLYADSAIQLLLPQLESGLFDENWRIRYSSVQLLGDLLYRISGVTGKMSTETASEDDNFGTEQSHQAIIRSLGAERRNRVLAELYMGRSDVALMVRQAALHVWKVVVTNTPRTLREILPTLFILLLRCLASDSYDKRQVAARTLGDLVRKLGERVLPEIIPILERGLQSPEPDHRQGVCIGLSEIMGSTSREMVLTFVNSLVPTVRKALCDPLPSVRQAAAKTFDSLHSTVGTKALDDILPALLNQLNDEDPEVVEWTLDGLRQVMAIKSRVVLPYLVPQLTSPPANTKALSILASVAGEALNKYLPRILPALQAALATSRGTPEEAQQLEYCQAVILSVVDETGIRTVVDTLLENTKNENSDQRRAAATLLCVFCANTKAQYTTHIPQLLRGLIHLCIDKDRDVLQMSWEGLNAITKSLEPKMQQAYVSDIRQAVRYAMSDVKDSNLLPGFCLPKGIAPILPILREAILNGDGDEKEVAALGLGEVIRVTSPEALQPSVVAITGPLIRILGDRFSASVKTAVLETLAILLEKVGIMLKQFLPQLQTTFVKALNDQNRTVRLKSAAGLGHLIVHHQKADNIFFDLHNAFKTCEDSAVKETTLHALRGMITPAGHKMSEPVKGQIHQTLIGLLSHQEETTKKCAAGCLGALCKYLSDDLLDSTLNEHLLVIKDDSAITLREGRGAALSVALKECPETLWQDQFKDNVLQTLLGQLTSLNVSIAMIGIRSTGYLLKYLMENDKTIPSNLLVPFVRTMNNPNNDAKQLLAQVCIYLARTIPQSKMSNDLLRMLLPMLVNGTKEKNMYVKANSELALIAVLHLRGGDAVYQKCLGILDPGAQESLSDVVGKVLRKILTQFEGKEEDLDDTLLT